MGTVTPETCRVVLQRINICILLHLLDFLFILTYQYLNYILYNNVHFYIFNSICHLTELYPLF